MSEKSKGTPKKVDPTQALEDIQKLVTRCHDSKHYMVAMWCIEDDTLHYLGKVCQGFPIVDFLTSVAQLSVDCSNEFKELSGPKKEEKEAPVPPLPLADLVKGLREEE